MYLLLGVSSCPWWEITKGNTLFVAKYVKCLFKSSGSQSWGALPEPKASECSGACVFFEADAS